MPHKARNTKSRRPDLYQQVTDRIIAALQVGTAPWVRPWSTTGEPGPQRNGASGHQYRGINTVLTGMSGFASSRWYTFKQAKALGGHVRRGEKGTKITLWRFIEPKSAADHGDDADGRRTIPILRLWTVFNAEQVEWPEGSKHAITQSTDGDLNAPDDNYQQADAYVAASGVDIQHHGVRAYYQPSADRVVVPPASRFDDFSVRARRAPSAVSAGAM